MHYIRKILIFYGLRGQRKVTDVRDASIFGRIPSLKQRKTLEDKTGTFSQNCWLHQQCNRFTIGWLIAAPQRTIKDSRPLWRRNRSFIFFIIGLCCLRRAQRVFLIWWELCNFSVFSSCSYTPIDIFACLVYALAIVASMVAVLNNGRREDH